MRIVDIKTILFIFLFLPVAMFFCFGEKSLAEENHLIINELLPNPTGSSEKKNEFIEIYNPSSETVDLTTWSISGKSETFPLFGEIKSKEYKTFYDTITLYNDKSTVELLHSGNVVDDISYPDPKQENFSYSFDGKNWKWTSRLTPGEKNIFDEASPSETNNKYAGKLKINELFPAPKNKNAGKEFVEIVNLSNESINLSGMRIEDEKNHKVSFSNEVIKSKDFFILEGNFELNNTTADTTFLIAKDSTKENPIDSVSYEKPKYDYAYAFNGSAWQWTSKITKGAENQFDKVLSGKIKMPKEIYAGVYADFEAKADKDAKKFTWNFGDNHKSYQKKTRHKYEKSGTYKASLKITGEGEDALLNFTVKVEKFSKAKVKVVSLSPNPRGKDSENEWIEILNATKKKINLKGWSVATGSKKLSNHPINKNFTLKAGETKKLTRDFCAFSLGNKEARIELRYPDGKVADKIKYDRKNNSVSEDELFQKEGGSWKWIEPQESKLTQKNSSEITPLLEQVILQTEPALEVKNETLENIAFDLSSLGKYSENPTWRKKQETQIALLLSGSNIPPDKMLLENQGRVLGISAVRPVQDKTVHIKSSNKFWKKINTKLNQLILFF